MSVPEYAAAGVSSQLQIGSYVGIPINNPEGELFGTLCGLDPDVQNADLVDHAPLLGLLSALLGAVLAADLQRAEEARERDRLQLAAETDALTDLYNRRGWERFLATEEEQYRKFGDPGSVIGLKAINDSDGHAAGDDMIRQCGRTVRRLIRSTDIVARLGGDEFGVLAVNTSPSQTLDFVTRLRGALANESIGASIGYAHYGSADGFAAVWEAADLAMYVDKSKRR
jgi:diguanylate cyclase (GGDEF)-like protein